MSGNGTIQVHEPEVLAPASFFTPAQEKMILSQFLGGATKEEAGVLLEIVKRRKLDPFARQVYFVKRWDSQKRSEVWAIQTSIDGLRSIAERTGKYDGQDDPVYGKDDFGEFCKVRVYRKDWSPGRAAVGTAYLAEFIQRKKDGEVTSFWARMPRLMLAKCAEALAIRKAFPEDTGGLYVPEEMGDDTRTLTAPPASLPALAEGEAAAPPGDDPPPAAPEVPPSDGPDEFSILRAALQAKDMKAAIKAIKALPENLQSDGKRIYSEAQRHG